MKRPTSSRVSAVNRRQFLRAGALGVGALLGGQVLESQAQEEVGKVVLPFENGERPLVKYPQKRPLIRLTTRPPQLETPFSVYNEGVLTPNDAFFVRYHLTLSPPPNLDKETFRVAIGGKVKAPLSLSVADLKSKFEPVEVVAVNQCSGNSRGFFKPRVAGGQSGNGNMGNAKWKGARLKDVLEKAGIEAGVKQVVLDGLDRPILPQTPDFIKALNVDHALDGEILLAYEMNGEDLPILNGFPLRVVVPGYYGTYWIKHVHDIKVVDDEFKGFWMATGYRIPAGDCAFIEPGTTPKKTEPIGRFNVRSFITSLADGAQLKVRQAQTVRGIAFDGGHGIQQVLFSEDDGRTWREAQLGKDLGRYSFREWTIPFTPSRKGEYALRVKATNRIGESQPMEALWNPAGYMRNVVETVKVTAA
ncbi:MAG: molybdopterin-dependent oxidoreductase [Verrucomicrobiota bacterium]